MQLASGLSFASAASRFFRIAAAQGVNGRPPDVGAELEERGDRRRFRVGWNGATRGSIGMPAGRLPGFCPSSSPTFRSPTMPAIRAGTGSGSARSQMPDSQLPFPVGGGGGALRRSPPSSPRAPPPSSELAPGPPCSRAPRRRARDYIPCRPSRASACRMPHDDFRLPGHCLPAAPAFLIARPAASASSSPLSPHLPPPSLSSLSFLLPPPPTGCSAKCRRSPSTRAITSGCCTGRVDSSREARERGAAGARVRHRRQAAEQLGRRRATASTGPSASTASPSTRRASSGSAATAAGPSRRRRQHRRHDPEVHEGRKVRDADRQARPEQGGRRHG